MTEAIVPPTEGYIWTNARVLTADVSVAAAAATPLLPDGLRLAEPATATLFIADYPETQFDSVYREAAVMLHVQDASGSALHCPWMVVDDDTALILGREMLGFPKKMAEISLVEEGTRVVGTVRRKDVEIMRLEAEPGESETSPAPLFGQRIVNAIGTLPGGMQLIDLPPSAEEFHTARVAQVRVTLVSSPRDALGALDAAEQGTGRYATLSFGRMTADMAPHFLGDVGGDWLSRQFYARAL